MNQKINSVGLIGAGMIGVSMAQALKQDSDACHITAIDLRLNKPTERLNRQYRDLIERGWIDRISAHPAAVLPNVELLILAIPLGAYAEYFSSFKPPDHLLISDVGSAKRCVLDCARDHWNPLPENLVPAHPMAGSADRGYAYARADLFQGSRVFVTPHANSNPRAVQKIEALWRTLGAEWVDVIEADAHDALLASTSHLPQLLSYILAHTSGKLQHQQGFATACGPGLMDMTRLAGADARMWRDICRYNLQHLLANARAYSDQLIALMDLLEKGDFAALEAYFTQANAERRTITVERCHTKEVD